MKKTHKSNRTLETLLVIGLILSIPLFFVIRTAAEQSAATNTLASAEPTIANAPAVTQANVPDDGNAMKPKQPPACTFPLAPLAGSKAEETMPEEYTFSEPQVVLTAPQGNRYNLAEWLPDNQQVLMTEDLNNVDVGNDKPNQQSISLYNPETGETKIIAFRGIRGAPPVMAT